MIEFRYTSGYHGLLSYIQWMFNIALIMLSFGLISLVLFPLLKHTVGILIIFALSVSLMLYINFKIIKDFPDNLSSFLYARLHLKVKMSYSEVKEIAFLFNPDWDGKWYPMEEVRELPKHLRKKFIFDFASRRRNRYYNNSQQTKSYDEYRYEQYWEQKKKEKFNNYKNSEGTLNNNNAHSDKWYEYLKILYLDLEPTFIEVKKAYLKQIKKFHPDKHQHLGKEFTELAESKTKELNEAYEFFKQEFGD